MIAFIVRLFALIGFLVVAGIAAAAWVVLDSGPELPDSIVIELDLDRPLAEAPGGGLEDLLRPQATLRDVLDVLERARTDPRVKGLVAHFGGDDLGFAQAQEIRAAVDRFRATGRFAFAFAEAFGDGAPGNRSYLVASAFDEIWLQPLGLVSVTGLSAEVPFARAALDELGIRPQIEQREQYKTLGETLTQRDFSPAHREMLESLVGDLTRQFVEPVSFIQSETLMIIFQFSDFPETKIPVSTFL